MYTAELKRPVKEQHSSKKAAVDALINDLGLETCRNVRIGNSMARGISGGQVGTKRPHDKPHHVPRLCMGCCASSGTTVEHHCQLWAASGSKGAVAAPCPQRDLALVVKGVWDGCRPSAPTLRSPWSPTPGCSSWTSPPLAWTPTHRTRSALLLIYLHGSARQLGSVRQLVCQPLLQPHGLVDV